MCIENVDSYTQSGDLYSTRLLSMQVSRRCARLSPTAHRGDVCEASAAIHATPNGKSHLFFR